MYHIHTFAVNKISVLSEQKLCLTIMEVSDVMALIRNSINTEKTVLFGVYCMSVH